MGYVINEMCDQVPKTFFRFNIFLATNMAVSSLHFCTTIKAVIIFSKVKMRHS